MAEAVAAIYAVETAVEGAVIGTYAASRPTVPLHARFRKLRLPEQLGTTAFKSTTGHSLNVVKGKGYVFGGEGVDDRHNVSMKIFTLPSSLENDEMDFQVLEPQVANDRPLQQYSAVSEKGEVDTTGIPNPAEKEQRNRAPEPRTEHVSASIDANIYIFGGRVPGDNDANLVDEKSEKPLYSLDVVYYFDTQLHTWSTLHVTQPDTEIPPPRTNASCTSIPHPQPGAGIDVTVDAFGTIFLHGGYDVHGNMLRDTWTFDVSSRKWTEWPKIPEPTPEEVPGEGKIICRGTTICRVGDGFGKMMYMDFDTVSNNIVGSTSGPHHVETGIKPRSTEWEVKTHMTSADNQPLAQTESLPMPRSGAGFVSVTTGSGRHYCLYFMGKDGPESNLNDIWSYQIKSEEQTAAALKDKVRQVFGKTTGEDAWALCEVVESTKADGPLEIPKGLSGFAVDIWGDLGGGNVVLWGGKTSDGSVVNEGWVLSVE